MERKSSASSRSSGWNKSLAAVKRSRDSISQSFAQKNRRIAKLQKQLGGSRLQVQDKDQRILELEDLVESLREQLEKGEGEVFKLKKENFLLRSKEGKWAEEVEKLKDDATKCNAEMEEALKAKKGAEMQMNKMEEEMKELSQSLVEIDKDDVAPASDDDAEEEDENQTGRDFELELQKNKWKEHLPLPVVSLSSPSSASSVVEVVTKAKIHQHGAHHAPFKPGSVVCRCGSSFSSVKGLNQHVRHYNNASAKVTPAKRRVNEQDEPQSAISRGKPRPGINLGRGQQRSFSNPKRTKCISSDESQSEEEPDEEEYEYL